MGDVRELQTYRCAATASTTIQYSGGKNEEGRLQNRGGAEVVSINGPHQIGLFDFDVSALDGMAIASAELWLHGAEGPITHLGVSTLASPWAAGGSDVFTAEEGTSCFYWARYSADPSMAVSWAGTGSDYTDVTFGEGGSLHAQGRLREEADGWLAVDLPPELVAALAVGDQYGLGVMEEKGQRHLPADVHSAGSAHPPYLLVMARPGTSDAPEAIPSDAVRVAPVPEIGGAVRVSWTAPPVEAPALGYEVRVSGEAIDESTWDGAAPVVRCRIPRPPKEGEQAVLELDGLAEGAPVRDAGDVRFQFRIDISRPEWQRGMLDGLTDLSCVSRAFFGKNRLLRQRLRDRGELVWNYGHANRLNASNLDMRAWAWTVWLMGGEGLLPWNTIGQNGSWERSDPLAVLYPGAPVGIRGPVAGTRLKALRRGQQDVELLALLAECEGWSRERVAEAVLSEMEIEAEQEEAFVDDAGQVAFSGVSVGAFSSVAKRVAKTICLA